jgi:hypothetical protein
VPFFFGAVFLAPALTVVSLTFVPLEVFVVVLVGFFTAGVVAGLVFGAVVFVVGLVVGFVVSGVIVVVDEVVFAAGAGASSFTGVIGIVGSGIGLL